MDSSDFFTVKEAAAKLDVSIRHLRKLVQEGKFAGSKKSGEAWIIPKSEIEHYYMKRKTIRDERIFRSHDVLTVKELAAELGVSIRHARKLVQEGTFSETTKCGDAWLIPKISLERFQAKREKVWLDKNINSSAVFTIQQVAVGLGLSLPNLRKLLNEGKFEGAEKFGKIWLIPKFAINCYNTHMAHKKEQKDIRMRSASVSIDK